LYWKVNPIKSFLTYFLLISACACIAQNRTFDSLLKAASRPVEDTNKINALNRLASGFVRKARYDTAGILAYQAIRLSQKLGYKKGLAAGCYYLGQKEQGQGNYGNAMKLYEIGLRLRRELGDKGGSAYILSGIASLHLVANNFTETLKKNLESLRIWEEAGDKAGTSTAYYNLGIVYYYLSEYRKSKECYTRAYEISRERGDKRGAANALLGLGSLQYEQGKFDEANTVYLEALQVQQEIRDLHGMGYTYTNLGLSNSYAGNYEQALGFLNKAVELRTQMGDMGGLANTYVMMAVCYQRQKKYAQAIVYGNKALELGAELEDTEDIRSGHEILSETYEALAANDKSAARKALGHFRKYISLRDSMVNEENTKKMVRLEMNYEFEKKEAATKLGQEKKDAVAIAEKRRQKIVLFAISGFGLLVLGFAVFAWRSFLQKKKANDEITRQKELIEQKQKEILDSIHYARRIQTALMPHEKYLDRNLQKLRSS
jgi:tetratricopeptide (TPR) repeat protein